MKKKVLTSILALSLISLTGCGETSTTPTNSTTPTSTVDNSTKTTTITPTVVDEDVVANTKMKIDDDLFALVMQNKSTRDYDADKADFNAIGVERVLTSSDYSPNKESDVFTNYVDGDTTQFTTYNGIYNVKVRYLAIDTPESTSEIEEWGKTASNFNKSKLKNAKHIIVQSAQCAKTGKKGAADLDGYGRSLAYVWYTDVENPTKDDFRNLNLELVYAGYSLFSGSRSEMDEDFYNAFMKAYDIAFNLKKGMFSDEEDPNYYYGKAKTLTLKDLYDKEYYTKTHKNNSDDDGTSYSMYCDYKTKYTFEGVVTRKVGTSFYIQDKIDGNYYGLYCFTLKSYKPVKVGNRIKVSGVLSWYSGSYELSGLSYSEFDHEDGDIEYVRDDNGKIVKETVTPVKATVSEINSGKYDNILCELVDDNGNDQTVYFNNAYSSGSNYLSGGSEEINGYNDTYPYYNTDNSMILFGRAGQDFTSNTTSFSTLMDASSNYVRVKVSRDVVISDENDTGITSYRYFSGSKDQDGKEIYHYYSPKHPSVVKAIYDAGNVYTGTVNPSEDTSITSPATGDMYVKGYFYNDETNGSTLCDVYYYDGTSWAIYDKKTGLDSAGNEVHETGSQIQLFRKQYNRKKVNRLVGIVQNYVSASGKNTKYSINIAQSNGSEEGVVYDFDNFEEVE